MMLLGLMLVMVVWGREMTVLPKQWMQLQQADRERLTQLEAGLQALNVAWVTGDGCQRSHQRTTCEVTWQPAMSGQYVIKGAVPW